jgi:DNA mismatch endonuclease (patch repair protein)
MSDVFSKEKRSEIMSRIKSRDTKIEIATRSYLFRAGFRFRKNDNRYPGKPDIVLPKYQAAIFIHGCFWHDHEGCKYSRLPKSNVLYWQKKMKKNKERDKKHIEDLEALGFKVYVLWECQLRKDFDGEMDKLICFIIKNQ